MKDLIIAASINYEYSDIEPFIESLNGKFQGDLVIFTNKNYKIKNKTYKIIIIDSEIFQKNHNTEQLNSFNNIRFFWCYDYLKENKNYANVFLADIRDVVFQENPFDIKPKKLYAAEEDNILENCPFNSDWILSMYGSEIYEKMRKERIYCCGTILGSYEQVLNLLEYMTDHLKKYGPILDSGDKRKMLDQGIFNYFVFNNKVLCQIPSNSSGSIFTMGYSKKICFDSKGFLINENGERYAIIHQYDRFKWLADLIQNKYQSKPKKWSLFSR